MFQHRTGARCGRSHVVTQLLTLRRLHNATLYLKMCSTMERQEEGWRQTSVQKVCLFGCSYCWFTQVITRLVFCSSVLWFLLKWLHFLCYLLLGITALSDAIQSIHFWVVYSHVKFPFERFDQMNKIYQKENCLLATVTPNGEFSNDLIRLVVSVS